MKTLRSLPSEVVASILAATTAFIGGTALHLPPWAIFIGWAGCDSVSGSTCSVTMNAVRSVTASFLGIPRFRR